MRISIQTSVEQEMEEVFDGFDQSLFLKLNPPFPPVKLLRFDGCKTGDWVVLKLNFIFFSQTWESEITDDSHRPEEISFIDQGRKLPFFLKKWKHHHRILSSENGSTIIDDIQYQGPNLLMTWLLYPVLYLQFWYRKPIYQKVFKRKK